MICMQAALTRDEGQLHASRHQALQDRAAGPGAGGQGGGMKGGQGWGMKGGEDGGDEGGVTEGVTC